MKDLNELNLHGSKYMNINFYIKNYIEFKFMCLEYIIGLFKNFIIYIIFFN